MTGPRLQISIASANALLCRCGQTFHDAGQGTFRDFRLPPERLSEIRRYVFGGFTKGCYQLTKFDSDSERRLAVILEQDPSVLLWMKPGPNQFKVFDTDAAPYKPDFVVETVSKKLIIETKANNRMTDADVLRKAEAASFWCYIANKAHGERTDGKCWLYLLVPDTAVQMYSTLSGLEATYARTADSDLVSRFDIYFP